MPEESTILASVPGRQLMPAPPMPTEEDRFFDFTKKYVALLATVASLPLITGALGVLEPPVTHKQLSLLASAFSVITFGAVFLLRSLLGKMMRRQWFALMPVTLVMLGVVGTLWTATHYMERTEAFNQAASKRVGPPRHDTAAVAGSESSVELEPWQVSEEIIWYLAIYPFFSLSLGLLAVSAFTQQKANTIQSLVAENLMDKADELERRVSDLSNFYVLASGKRQETFRKVGQELVVDENGRHLSQLANGILYMRGEQAIKLHMILQRCFNERFDAASKTDLNFWCKSKRDAFATEYLKINSEAIKNKTRVNRIFLLEDSDLLRWKLIQDVLNEQDNLGIGWGLVPMEALDPLVKGNEVQDLDFALFNFNRAVSFFREPNSRFRHLEVMFDVDREENQSKIWEQANRFLELVAQCWFVNEKLLDDLATLSTFVPQVKRKRESEQWTPRVDNKWSEDMTTEDWFRYVIAQGAFAEAGKYERSLTRPRRIELANTLKVLEAATKHKPSNVKWDECLLFGLARSEEDTRQFVCQTLKWRMTAADWHEDSSSLLIFELGEDRLEAAAVLISSTISGFESVEQIPKLKFSWTLKNINDLSTKTNEDQSLHRIVELNGDLAKAEHRIPLDGNSSGLYSLLIQVTDLTTSFSQTATKDLELGNTKMQERQSDVRSA
jgi:hypothetical protein